MVFYMSMEFLQGRALLNAVSNLGLAGEYGAALKELGTSLEEMVECEQDMARAHSHAHQ